MKRTGMILGMAVLVLSLSLAVTGCSDDGGDKNSLDTFNWNTTFNSAAESASGRIISQLEAIRDAGGGGFRGWLIDEDEYGEELLVLAWTGRTVTNYNAVRTHLGGGIEDNEPGILGSYGNNWHLNLVTSKISEDGLFFDAGTMILLLWNN